jgi:hypothetical protein
MVVVVLFFATDERVENEPRSKILCFLCFSCMQTWKKAKNVEQINKF